MGSGFTSGRELTETERETHVQELEEAENLMAVVRSCR